MVQNDELSTKQKRAIACLLAERSISAAAKTAKVGQNTLFVWLSQPAFKAALLEAENGVVDESVRALVRVSVRAVEVLEDILNDPDASASVKVRAAASVIDGLLKLKTYRELEERVAALEARYEQRS